MKILLVASEMAPYAKTGGLGDVVGGLSSALRERGHEVTCCLPYYRSVPKFAPGAKPIGLTLSIPLGSRAVTGDVLEWTQADGVRVLFIRRDEFFDRSELYNTSVRDYEDNAERFLFFSKAVVELIGYTRFRPDVVHCHDWQTAFVPVQLSHKTQAGTLAPPLPKTVLTIHNIAYQGMFWSLDFPLANLPGEFFTPDTLEFYGQMNLLKGGIVFADTITTVSPTYAEEIQTPEGGFGLDTVVATRGANLRGIINGVDYTRWNPETDPHLRQRYGPGDLSGKLACRADLLKTFGIQAGATEPVAGFVSRLTAQKGVEILAGALEELIESGLSLAILGKGERAVRGVADGRRRTVPGPGGGADRPRRRTGPPDPGRCGHVIGAVALRAMRADAVVRAQVRDDPRGAGNGRPGRHGPGVRPADGPWNRLQICSIYVGGIGGGRPTGDFAPQTAEEMAEVDGPRDGRRFFVAGQRG